MSYEIDVIKNKIINLEKDFLFIYNIIKYFIMIIIYNYIKK